MWCCRRAAKSEGDKMKKRIVSTLLALCMLLCLMPTAAFAEGSTETPPVCSCETACTAESMNAACPVCGAEGALPENCAAKCAQPADNAAAQPEGEVSDPQPETALTALSGEGETPAAGETLKEVSTANELTAAMADSSVNTVKLASDINIDTTLTVNRTVTLDLNGFVLRMTSTGVGHSVIALPSGGTKTLTLKDSNPSASHKFAPQPDGLWILDETNGTETVLGGIITGGYDSFGGGVCVDMSRNNSFIMDGGNIVGCRAQREPGYFGGYGGGVYCAANFTMNSGSIVGCVGFDYDNSNSAHYASTSGSLYVCGINAVLNGGTVQDICVQAPHFTLGDATIQGTVDFIMDDEDVYGNDTSVSGVFNCDILNRGILKGDATFYGNVTNTGTIYGGTFYGSVTGGSISDSAKVGVTFATDGGSTVDAQKVIRGQKAAKPTAPTKAGYTFLGWYDEDNKAYDFNQPVTEGINLTAKWMAGAGTPDDPYLISNAEELKIFHDIVNGENGRAQNTAACATLTADIVLNDGTFAEDGNYTPGPSGAALTEWSPMGVSNSTAYAGTFDGAGHTIQGLYRSANNSLAGLFGLTNGATIKNVKVTGYLGSAKSAGGIAAHTEQTTITGCVNAATVNAYTGGQESIGGIVGITELSSQIIDCINIGVIKCQAGDADPVFAGGIAGYLSSDSTISSCSNDGKVIGACNDNGSYCRSQIGGIVGIATLGTITDCYNAGSVTDITPEDPNSDPWVGGIVGSAPGHSSKYLSVTISNCYSTGSVTANNNTAKVGGITGNAENIAITNCYYLTGTAGQVCGKSDTVSTVTNTTDKSAFDFANGDVLKRLKKGTRTGADPWEKECKYLAAAGKTLPVFKGQGDAHEHNGNWTSNGNGTHSRRCTCNAVETEKCSGGTATCIAEAVCEFCKASYGSRDQNNHTDLKHIEAKAATAAAEGNIEYWYCDGCKKYFSDAAAKTEITKAATVTAKLPPKITAGDGATVTQGEKKELSFTSDASFADFLRVELDGTTLDEKNYTKREGSTIITLNRDFVAALSAGEYTLSIVSKSGTATAKFTVKAKPTETTTPQPTVTPQPTAQPQPTVQPISPIPRTGDAANPALWFALLIVSGSALAAISVLRRKANRK